MNMRNYEITLKELGKSKQGTFIQLPKGTNLLEVTDFLESRFKEEKFSINCYISKEIADKIIKMANNGVMLKDFPLTIQIDGGLDNKRFPIKTLLIIKD